MDITPPSFSLGLTQDFQMVLSMESPIADRNTPVRPTHFSEPVKAVPVSMVKPVLQGEDVAKGRAKRKYTKAQVARSPYFSRVCDIHATESKDEKIVESLLLNKTGIDQR